MLAIFDILGICLHRHQLKPLQICPRPCPYEEPSDVKKQTFTVLIAKF